jgi:hypothetical protein
MSNTTGESSCQWNQGLAHFFGNGYSFYFAKVSLSANLFRTNQKKEKKVNKLHFLMVARACAKKLFMAVIIIAV